MHRSVVKQDELRACCPGEQAASCVSSVKDQSLAGHSRKCAVRSQARKGADPMHHGRSQDEPLPPVVSFAMGTLGFLTPFESADAAATLARVLAADSADSPVFCTLRTRRRCEVVWCAPAPGLALAAWLGLR